MDTYMQTKFDKIIISTDENNLYYEFIPIVAEAWNKFFPECELHIAFVTERDANDTLVKKMDQYGIVHLFKAIPNIPTCSQAKMSRHILASSFGDSVCMLEDVDTIPLQREYYEDRTSQREQNHILIVGAEVYIHPSYPSLAGKFPMSTITAEGTVFKEIINPNNLSDTDLMQSWVVEQTPDGVVDTQHIWQTSLGKGLDFSDESLISVLLQKWDNTRITYVKRDTVGDTDWIDRSKWSIDENKLVNCKYVLCNFLRPFSSHYEQIKPIVDFIYGNANMTQEQVVLTES